VRLSRMLLAGAVVVAAAGCGGGGGGGSSGTRLTAGGIAAGGAPAVNLKVSTVATLPASYSIRSSAQKAPITALDVVATGADLNVKSLTLRGAGSVNEGTDVSALRVAVDNGDGVYSDGLDVIVGGTALFSGDDGNAIIGGINRTVKPGTPQVWWVVVDMAGTALPGKTVAVNIVTGTAVDVVDGTGAAAPVTGIPALSPVGTVFQGDHLMISEIVVTPTGGEFVEIYNPTAQTVDLSTVYLSDAEDNGSSPAKHYYNLPTNQNFGSFSSSDFHVRFPAGASIPAGGFVTVALSSDAFAAQYGKTPNFEMVQDGATDGVTDLVIVGPTPTTYTAGLSNSAEIVVLYRWDGQSDVVEDLDIVQWGTSVSAFYVDKSSVAIDGPDQNSTTTAYKADSAMMLQDKAQENTIGTSMKRIDFAEYGENQTAGNGVTGHDETSENFGVTWNNLTPPTPGTK